MGLRALIREFINEMQARRGTSPYDTEAEVLRVENGKAWVKIPGGVPETPVDIGMNAEKGDIVKVRVSGGRAWLQSNLTHPATDDKTAQAAQKLALSARTKANDVQREADKLIVITNEQGEQIGYAITTANGKNKTYHQASEPTGGEYADGDVWFDTDDDNKMYRWNGSSWAAVVLGDDALESISANKITAGTIDASQITVSNLDAGNITTGTIDAARLNIGDIISSGSILVAGDNISGLNNDSGYQTAGDVNTAISGKADKSGAVSSTVPVYYRSTSSSVPSISSSTSIGTSSNTDNAWEYVMPQPKRSRYFFICEKYTYANGTVSFSTVRELTSENYASKWCSSSDSTYIDGGRIYTGSITANEIAANTITASEIAANTITASELAAYAVKTIGTNANNYAQMDANGMVIYKGGYLSASFGGTVYLYGRDSNGNVKSTVRIDSSSANINGFDIQTITNSDNTTFTVCESNDGLRLIGAGTTFGLYSGQATLDSPLKVNGLLRASNVHEIATAVPVLYQALTTSYAEVFLTQYANEGSLVIGSNLSIIPYDEGYSYSGIKCLKAGHVMVSGQLFFESTNDHNVCMAKITKGSTRIVEAKERSAGSAGDSDTTLTLGPKIISVAANDIIHIYAKNASSGTGYVGTDNSKDFLTVQYV